MLDEIERLRKNGFTYREIAQKTSCSVGRVYYLLNPDYRKRINEKQRKNYKPKKIKKAKPDNSINRKNRMLNSRYGLTFNQYLEIYISQGMCCAICGHKKHLGGRCGLYVDHNHENGKVRGLLCPNCNSAIGKLNESPYLFKKALQYLKEHL